MKKSFANKAIQDWDNNWKNTETIPEWDNISQLVLDVLLKEINELENIKIFEAGSGTGRISMVLAQKGAKVYLTDTSKKAMEISKNTFDMKNIKGTFERSSIFTLPFRNESFDIVWNAGVLEHFSRNEQIEALKEMKRVCKKNGKIITLNPHSKAIFYLIGKWYAEKTKIWRVYEKPIGSLEKIFKEIGINSIAEYTCGIKESIDFLKYIPFTKYIIFIIKKFEKPIACLKIKGYLLVTIGELRE